MSSIQKNNFYQASFLKYDIKASVTVFLIALPLCLGVSLASGTPVYAGLLAGMVGGVVIPLISKSTLSVSGPAAGLTAICALAITNLGSIEMFFLSVGIAGVLQILLGIFRLGGFTHFIPSAVIKGMLAAIGIILMGKQIPLLIGYDESMLRAPEFFNLPTLHHVFLHVTRLASRIPPGNLVIATLSMLVMTAWIKWVTHRLPFVPAPFIVVVMGSFLAIALERYFPAWKLNAAHYVYLPENVFSEIKFPVFSAMFSSGELWGTAVVICFVATLETLLSIEAIDKLDPENRITPQNRELVAQGVANVVSGILGGIPITSVIIRSAANAEAGAKTRLSAFLHGLWLLLTVLFAASVVKYVPYCVLAVILIRTGYNLARPAIFKGVYRQGREQFLPFIVTVAVVLTTDLLIGVLLGSCVAVYFLVKHTYRAGYSLVETNDGDIRRFNIELALNVSFLNKKRFMELLDGIPEFAVVRINGSHSIYIDHDILEILHTFRAKAASRSIQLTMTGIPEATVVEIH